MSSWDWVIGISIIGALILVIWARVSGMTIPELLREIREIFVEKADVQERIEVISR